MATAEAISKIVMWPVSVSTRLLFIYGLFCFGWFGTSPVLFAGQFMVDGELFFDPNPSRGETLQWRAQGATASWTVSLELKHSEAQ